MKISRGVNTMSAIQELKLIRGSTGKNPEEFAKELGISKSLYTKIECGNRKPSNNVISKIKKRYPFIDTNIFFTK
jgi:transcriptional regulator with XRE-family HTH domain